jgi:hypothetical protein
MKGEKSVARVWNQVVIGVTSDHFKGKILDVGMEQC